MPNTNRRRSLAPSAQQPPVRMTRRACQQISALSLACGLLVSAAVALPQPAQAGKNQWVRVLSEGNKLWFVDTGSIKRKGTIRYFWSYIQADAPVDEGDHLVAGSAYYLSVDCKSHKYRLRHAQTIDAKGKVVQEENFGDEKPLGEIVPGSGEAASINYVCARK